MDLSKRANLLGVREVRGLVLAEAESPTGLLGADWSPFVEVRADGESNPNFWTFSGAASIVDNPYTVRDMFGEFTETIVAGAFDVTLSQNPDVMFNYMHDPATTMATTRGGGLTLKADPHLSFVARVPKSDTDGQRIAPKVERGDARSASFSFRVSRQEWDEDYLKRWITEVNLHRGDVASIVTGLGANPPAYTNVRALGTGGHIPQPYQSEPDETVGCLHCGQANSPDAQYCDQCGFQLGNIADAYSQEPDENVICPSCGCGNEPDARFCDQCGFQLEGAYGVVQNSALAAAEYAQFLKDNIAVALRDRSLTAH